MDPATIGILAAAAVKVVSGFFASAASKAGEQASDAAATGAVEGAKRLVKRIRDKFRSDPTATRQLQDLETEPADSKAAQDVEHQLVRLLQADEAFAETLASDLKLIAATNADVAFVNNIQGDVGKLVQIDTVHGDVHL
jgi:hypothetical protein